GMESESDLHPTIEGIQEREASLDVADITDFEVRIRQYRQDALVRSAQSNQEERIRAVYVRFASGYYAFLTDNHKVPVATDILAQYTTGKQELPRKSLSELRVGDYVVFREGAHSDVLREWADRGLLRAGKGNLRAVASLWKEALREFVGILPEQRITYLNTQR